MCLKINGAKPSPYLNEDIVTSVSDIGYINGSKNEIVICLLILPVLTSLALGMIQFTVSIITQPIVGFLVSQSIVFISTFYEKSI